MKVRIDTHFMDYEAGKWRAPGYIIEVRDALGEEWISKGWGIELKDDAPKKAALETPEDELESSKRETATVRRKAQHE